MAVTSGRTGKTIVLLGPDAHALRLLLFLLPGRVVSVGRPGRPEVLPFSGLSFNSPFISPMSSPMFCLVLLLFGLNSLY